MDIQYFSSWRLIDHRSANRSGDLENMEMADAFLKVAKLENKGRFTFAFCSFFNIITIVVIKPYRQQVDFVNRLIASN